MRRGETHAPDSAPGRNRLFVDIHTHVEQYDDSELPGVLQRAAEADVGAIVVAGVTAASSARAVALAHANPALFAAVGAHPQDLGGPLSDTDLGKLDALAGDEAVVAMSEIGLDFQPSSLSYGDQAPGDQEAALRAQIGIARNHDLAVIWHMREATAECLRIMRDEKVGGLRGAAHYFQGSYDEASAVIDMGCKISLAKPLLRLPWLQDVAARIPLSAVVLETDSFPQPFKKNRAKWTEPRDIPLVAQKLADLRGIEVSEVMAATTENALSLLGARGEQLATRLGE